MIELKLTEELLGDFFKQNKLIGPWRVKKGIPRDADLVHAELQFVNGIGPVVQLVYDLHDGNDEIESMSCIYSSL